MRESELAARLELRRTDRPDPDFEDAEAVEAALASSPALAARSRALAAFDERVRAAMDQVDIPIKLQARLLQALAQPAAAEVGRSQPPTRRSRRSLIGWTSIALAVVVGLAGRHLLWRSPGLTLEAVATDARRVFSEVMDKPAGWRPARTLDLPRGQWPDDIDIAAVVGVQAVTLLEQEVIAYRLVARKQSALVVLVPLDAFPAGFEFGQINNSGLPVKVLAHKEMAAIVVVENEADFGLFRAQPPLIGYRVRSNSRRAA